MSHWWTDYSDYCNQYVASSYYGLGSSSAATQWWSRSDHCSVEKQRRVVVQWRSSTLPTALIGAWRAGLYQWKMRPTRSDHWPLNLLLPGGSALISHWWIRGTRLTYRHIHTHTGLPIVLWILLSSFEGSLLELMDCWGEIYGVDKWGNPPILEIYGFRPHSVLYLQSNIIFHKMVNRSQDDNSVSVIILKVALF